MEFYRFIAIVLVYRNYLDLVECIESMQQSISSIRIVVVNAYYNDETKNRVQEICDRYHCVFINIENKGYGFGNNRGITFAMAHFNFEFIIIANPDTIVQAWDETVFHQGGEFDIIAPKIIAASGKLQNPMCVKRSAVSELLTYWGLKYNAKLVMYMGIGITKIIRMVGVQSHNRANGDYSIYAAHGSFVILSRKTVEELYPVYDENMFLFAEEGVLAYKAQKSNLKTGQCNRIVIRHKEDGSMKLSDFPINNELRKSNLYYYDNYIRSRR